MALPGLTILNRYELIGVEADFIAAITDLAKRVEAEGHPGVLSYRFWVNGSDRAARAVIDYEDDAAWLGHHDIAMDWPEMKALHRVARLSEVTFLGAVTPAIRSWIDNSTLQVRLREGNRFAAGFARPASTG